MEKLKVLSLGAGVQSSTLLLMCERGEFERPDYAIFADTQAEPESVYRWLDWLEAQVSIPIRRVSNGSLTRNTLRLRKHQKTGRIYWHANLPWYVKNPDRSAGNLWRKCTADYKVRVIISDLRKMTKGKPRQVSTPYVESWIGISRDEVIRMKPSREPWIQHRWPLIELGMTRRDCKTWMDANGYPEPPRSACIYCPYHSNAEWRQLKLESPEEFEKAVEFERECRRLAAQDQTTLGDPFLHNSLVSLDQVDFRNAEDRGQLNLFNNECEGMCGV